MKVFRTYQVLFNRLLLCIDALIIVASYTFAWYVKFQSGWLKYTWHATYQSYLGVIVFGVIVFLVTNWVVGLYRPMRAKSIWSELFGVLRSAVLGVLVFMSSLYFVKLADFSRDVIILFASSFVVLTLLERFIIRLVLRVMRSRGFNQKFILIVGWNHAAERFVTTLEHQPWFGYRVHGYLTDDASSIEDRQGVPCIGTLSDMQVILENNLVDQVVIALPRTEFSAISKVIALCELIGTQSLILPDYFDLLPARPRFETFGDMPLIDTRYVPLDDAMNAALKRTFDIVFSAIVMLVFVPFFLLILLGVKLSSSGPVLHVQERVGKNRRTFKMYKFRTMYQEVRDTRDDETSEEQPGWTTARDQRRTKFGAFLRKTSLDELPQFWNVFNGDMSVIGPRPERPYFVEQFKDEIPKYMVKHRVRPGITGWAQVNGWRGDTSISQRIQYDIEYIENWSFWMDMRIIARTFVDGFIHPNAY